MRKSFRRTSKACKGEKLMQCRAFTISHRAEFLRRQAQAIDPECGIPKHLGAGCVPACEGYKQNLLLWKSERRNTQLIRLRSGFVGTNLIRTDHVFEDVIEARALDRAV